ncbi:hypothetical protein [Hallerella sp.]|nr:hypothetical protein [Hallerella sp.]
MVVSVLPLAYTLDIEGPVLLGVLTRVIVSTRVGFLIAKFVY